jgi:hypothetical protein
LVTPEIDELLDGKRKSTGFPNVEADLVVGIFLGGLSLNVSRRWLSLPAKFKRRFPQPDLERLENVDEVWAMCFRKPSPGWRLLGRFLEPKVFVALGAYDGGDLHHPRGQYVVRANEAISKWQADFPAREPFRSQDVTGYLGEVFFDVDAQYDFESGASS